MKLLTIAFALVCTGFLLSSCKDDTIVGEDGSPSTVVFPDSGVSYPSHVQPLFDQACSFSGCHDAGTRAAGLNLTTSAFIVGNPGVVVPRDPDNSLLVLRVTGARGLPRMPINRNALNANQQRGLRTWILEGARP